MHLFLFCPRLSFTGTSRRTPTWRFLLEVTRSCGGPTAYAAQSPRSRCCWFRCPWSWPEVDAPSRLLQSLSPQWLYGAGKIKARSEENKRNQKQKHPPKHIEMLWLIDKTNICWLLLWGRRQTWIYEMAASMHWSTKTCGLRPPLGSGVSLASEEGSYWEQLEDLHEGRSWLFAGSKWIKSGLGASSYIPCG